MKKILLTLAILLSPGVAWAQCNGVFPANTFCGNNTASPALPSPVGISGAIIGPNTSVDGQIVTWQGTTGGAVQDQSTITSSQGFNFNGSMAFGGSITGFLPFTNSAAPSTPASGKDSIWTDSTDKRIHDKNDAGTIGTTAVAISSVASNWLTGMSAAGIFSQAQPAFTDISGSVACGQMPALTGNVTSSAGSCATTIAASVVTNSMLANMATSTVKGNFSGGSAAPSDASVPSCANDGTKALTNNSGSGFNCTNIFNNATGYTIYGNTSASAGQAAFFTPSALANQASPAASDLLVLADASTGQLKNVLVSAISSAGSVSSIAGNTGSFTLSHCIINSTNDIRLQIPCVQNYLSGLTIANDSSGGHVANDISVAAGAAADSTNTQIMVLASALTQKQLNNAWVAGSTQGCLDTGAVGNNTYFIFLILQTTGGSNVDVLCSLSPSAPTMPTNYTLKRRIGAVIRQSAANVLFTQVGNQFFLNTGVHETNITNVNVGTTATNYTLVNIPNGIVVTVNGSGCAYATGTPTGANFYPTIIADQSVSYANFTNVRDPSNGAGQCVQINVLSNASAQIRARGSAAGTTIDWFTTGWIDTRGQ